MHGNQAAFMTWRRRHILIVIGASNVAAGKDNKTLENMGDCAVWTSARWLQTFCE